MNRISFILFFLVSAISFKMSAQDAVDKRDELVFGMKAGINYSNVYDSRGEAFVANSKFGLAAGAFISIPFIKVIGLQPEVLLSQKGFKGTGQLLGDQYSFTRTSTYIDIPFFFALKPTPFLTLLAGPQYSYLIKQRDEFANGPNSYLQEQEFKNQDIHKNTLCFAGGADVNIGHGVFGLRAGWDLIRNNGDGTSSIPQYKNVWYQATIGYRFY